jgi:GxxExxY protein
MVTALSAALQGRESLRQTSAGFDGLLVSHPSTALQALRMNLAFGQDRQGPQRTRRVGRDIESLVTQVFDSGLSIHREFGPGLLESAYEAILCHRLAKRGIDTKRQVAIPILVDGLPLAEGFRADVIVEGVLLLELKSIPRFAGTHLKQVLTYLRLADLRIGLLLNFGAPTFKEGFKRIVNDYHP